MHMGKKTKTKKRNKPVDVDGSPAHRRQSHKRKGTNVVTSKPLRISGYDRARRRTKEEINTVVRRNKNKSLEKKRDLPLKDQKVLKRRGYL